MEFIDRNTNCPHCLTTARESAIVARSTVDTDEEGIKEQINVRACKFCRFVYVTFERQDLRGVVGNFQAVRPAEG